MNCTMSGAAARAIADQVADPIAADIARLLDTGVALSEILVNDGDDRWGANCAVSLATAQRHIADWHAHAVDSGTTVDDLELAEKWLTQRCCTDCKGLNGETQ